MSTEIDHRLRNHINPKAFKHYTSMPRCFYNAADVIEGINFGHLLNANQQRLNGAFNKHSELLTDCMININIIEYLQQNTQNDDESHWKLLRDHLKADNDALNAIFDKMQKKTQNFNDIQMNEKEFEEHQRRNHQNAWICLPKLSEHKLSESIEQIQTLKNVQNENDQKIKKKDFEISTICKGLPNGMGLMQIAKKFEAKDSEFSIGNRTLMDLPVNDSLYPVVMAEFIDKYCESTKEDEENTDDGSVITEYTHLNL